MKDWLYLALCVAMFACIPIGGLLIGAQWTYLGTFLIAMGASASIGCGRLLMEFVRHGIHNDR